MTGQNVTRIRHALPVSAEIAVEVQALEVGILAAIRRAKDAGLPQGFIVSMLHGHAQAQTMALIE